MTYYRKCRNANNLAIVNAFTNGSVTPEQYN